MCKKNEEGKLIFWDHRRVGLLVIALSIDLYLMKTLQLTSKIHCPVISEVVFSIYALMFMFI